MTSLPDRVDVAVVGAGTSGAAAAAACARRGLRVLCVDRGPLAQSGAHWVNGVPGWHFAEADVAAPTGPELVGVAGPLHLVAGWGPRRVVIRDHGVMEVDMRLLVARLQQRAADAGAVLAGDVAVRGFDGQALQTDRGPVQARWVVDGLTGHLLDQPAPSAARPVLGGAIVPTSATGRRRCVLRRPRRRRQVLCFSGIVNGYRSSTPGCTPIGSAS
jgi:glycine/D-amino acid oxidase-like deaminating enzyme